MREEMGSGENVIPLSERLLPIGGGRPPLERRRLQVREPSDSGDPALGGLQPSQET